jgi:hypothetical protein
MKEKHIKVLKVAPMERPSLCTLENELSSLQKAVSIGADYIGLIEIIDLDEEVCCKNSIDEFSYEPPQIEKRERSLEDLLGQLGETFPQALERMMKERGLKNPDVYKRANLTRQHFSKILNSEGYQPKKEAVLALAIALKLNLDETRDFLGRAGYALTRNSKMDVIVQFFIESGNYDIYEVEQVLFEFTGRTLASY